MTKYLRRFLLRKMLIMDCETWHLSVVLVSMTIFGQKDFWNVSIVTDLIFALIELIRLFWCPKHRNLSHRKFLSGGNTWKTIEIWVFKNKPKSCMVAMATYMSADWWNWTFLKGIYIEKNSPSSNSKLQAVLEICCDLGEGHKVPLPPPWPG